MNRIIIVGNLVADPETKAAPNGATVCTFRMAANRKRKNADGEKVADFFRVTTWRGLAETCDRFLDKGSEVLVVGELQPRQYEKKDGGVGFSLDVEAESVEFLSLSKDKPKAQKEPKSTDPNTFQDISSDDIPF